LTVTGKIEHIYMEKRSPLSLVYCNRENSVYLQGKERVHLHGKECSFTAIMLLLYENVNKVILLK